MTHVAFRVAELANPAPFALWTVGLASVALYRRRPRHALAVLVLLTGANVIAQTLKVVLAHERFHEFLGNAQLSAASLPSGHATASMTLAFAAVLVAPAAWRPVVAVLGAAFAVAVSESIMLLAWHFPSDVAAGFVVATACTLATVAGLRAAEQRWPQRSGREAAQRAFLAVDLRVALGTVAGLAGLVVVVMVVAAGDRTLTFAGRHTTAVIAAVVVAAMAAAPLAISSGATTGRWSREVR